MIDRVEGSYQDRALARLKQEGIPAGVMQVIERLQDKGYRAVLVGGGVRDCVLQRETGDWDLATSARPEEVQACFKKTIPTGIEHGTVTVLPRGHRDTPVEITTFRGESEYHDGRRPVAVEFLDDLEADLARRDFTINAMAWDPLGQELCDPFDGLLDLEQRRIRAVGVARDRFLEDGLRTMRALRFSATLGFDLEAQTQEALGEAVAVLAKVSRERIRVELEKLLGARAPSSSLRTMLETGLFEVVLSPHCIPDSPDERQKWWEWIDALPPEPWTLRLAALLWPAATSSDTSRGWLATLEALRPSKKEKREVQHLLSLDSQNIHGRELSAVQMRELYVALGPKYSALAIELARWTGKQRSSFEQAVAACPAGVAELEIGAKALQASTSIQPGPQLGQILRELLQWVVEDPSRNEANLLLQRARELLRSE